MAGLFGDDYDDEPRGLLGGLSRGMTNPLFLAGAGLLSGEGFGGAMQGLRMGAAFQDQRLQQAEQMRKRQQFDGLIGQINAPPDVLALARMQGPDRGAQMLGSWVGPWQEAQRLELEMKRAQIEKVRWEQEQASQASARQKALYDALMGGGTATPPQPTPSEPASSDAGVGRWATPGLVGGGAGTSQPQTPKEIFQSLPPNKRAQAQVALAQGDMKEFGKIIGEGAPQLADNLTPGEKRVDQAFAKNYEDFVLSGGAADFDKNLKQMRGVHGELTKPESKRANLTGPILGRMPDAITSVTHPEAVDARQRVEEVVQRNLRIILGAQFTQKEGENLIARAYNPALDEATNAKRLDRLISSMEKMKNAKLKAMDYFERHGTMKGFKGTTQFTADDIIADLEAPEQRNFNWTPDGGLQEAE